MRGGRRPFGIFPNIHPIWYSHPSLIPYCQALPLYHPDHSTWQNKDPGFYECRRGPEDIQKWQSHRKPIMWRWTEFPEHKIPFRKCKMATYQRLIFFFVTIFPSGQKTGFARRGEDHIFHGNFPQFDFFFLIWNMFFLKSYDYNVWSVRSSIYCPHYASHEIPVKKRVRPCNSSESLCNCTHLYRLVGWSYCLT